jgi:hypothetical protein
MKPPENQNRYIPEMGETFDKNIFKRQVADFLRKNELDGIDLYVEELVISFPIEASFILTEVERMKAQRAQLAKNDDLKFDDYRSAEQRQTFYEGLSTEPSVREKMEDFSQRVETEIQEEEPTPLSGPDVRYFG